MYSSSVCMERRMVEITSLLWRVGYVPTVWVDGDANNFIPSKNGIMIWAFFKGKMKTFLFEYVFSPL